MLQLYIDAKRVGSEEAQQLKADWTAFSTESNSKNEWRDRIYSGWEVVDFQTLLSMVETLEHDKPLKTGNALKRLLDLS